MTEEAIENVLRDARATWRKAAERDEYVVRAASERRLRDVRPRSRAPYVAAGLALAVILLWFGVRETRGPVVAAVAIEPDPSALKPVPTIAAESPAPSVVPSSIPSAKPAPPSRPVPTVSMLPPLPAPPPPRSRVWFRSDAADAVGSARIAAANAELERGKVDAARERLRQIIDSGSPSSVVGAASLLATTYDAPADKLAVWDKAIPHLPDGSPQRAKAERARARLLVSLVRDGGG